MTLEKKILTGFIACATILFGVAIFSYNNSQKFIASNAWVNHTNQVVYQLDQILVTTIDAQNGTRGYVITGNIAYLEPFTIANKKIFEHLDLARELTRDNPGQQKILEELEKLIQLRFTHLNKTIAFRNIDFEKARESVISGEGKELQDKIINIIQRAQQTELVLLASRKQTSEEAAGNFNFVFAILLLIIVTILVVVYLIVTSNLKALKRSEKETADKNWLLTGSTELNDKLKGDQTIEQLANNAIGFLCNYLKANIGAIYHFIDKENAMILSGKYAFSSPTETKVYISMKEGLIGQAAWEQKQICLTDIPEEHVRITSSVLRI